MGFGLGLDGAMRRLEIARDVVYWPARSSIGISSTLRFARASCIRSQRPNHNGWFRHVSETNPFGIRWQSGLCAASKNLRGRAYIVRPIQSGTMYGNATCRYHRESRPETYQHIVCRAASHESQNVESALHA